MTDKEINDKVSIKVEVAPVKKKYTHNRQAAGSTIETPYSANGTRKIKELTKILDNNLKAGSVISLEEGTLTITKSND